MLSPEFSYFQIWGKFGMFWGEFPLCPPPPPHTHIRKIPLNYTTLDPSYMSNIYQPFDSIDKTHFKWFKPIKLVGPSVRKTMLKLVKLQSLTVECCKMWKI